MQKYKITIEYDGTGYRGWQVQKNARSVQGTLLETAKSLLGNNIEIQGAGRTDAGVHALAQVAHLATDRRINPPKFRESWNDLLPAGINIKFIDEAPPDFHARHHAKLRSYVYLISKRRTAFGKRYVWWIKDRLDVNSMRAACTIFQGFHDFASFADKRRDLHESSHVELSSVELHAYDNLILLRIVGSHFLWKMVRRMVGVTVEAGRGELSPENIEGLLTQFSELPAKLTAPASGLFLEQVLYEEETLKSLMLPALPLIFLF